MLVDNKNFREAGHIADEILSDVDLAMRSKCLAVEGTVSSGVLTLEKALKIYQVPKERYYDYLAKNHAAIIDSELASDSPKEKTLSTINVFSVMLSTSLSNINPAALEVVVAALGVLSKDIEKDKVAYQ